MGNNRASRIWKGANMKFRLASYLFLSILLLFSTHLSLPTAKAQAGEAELTGEVRDQTGAALAEASISATEVRTNQTYVAHTGASGAFTLTNLKPGLYKVSVEAKGF